MTLNGSWKIQKLDAAGNGFHVVQPFLDGRYVHAEDHRQRRGGQRVINVEHAGHLHADFEGFDVAQLNGKVNAAFGNLNIAREQIGIGPDAVREIGDLQIVENLAGWFRRRCSATRSRQNRW